MNRISLLFLTVCLSVTAMAQSVTSHLMVLPDDADAVADSIKTAITEVIDEADNGMTALADTMFMADSASVADMTDTLAVDPQRPHIEVPPYVGRSVFRSWRRAYPLHPTDKRRRNIPYRMRRTVDSLRAEVNDMKLDKLSDDLLFLYDMRLPVINSGFVPADSTAQLYEDVQHYEDASDRDDFVIGHHDDRYTRQHIFEEQRHRARFNYAAADPRRFRYARRKFDVPSAESHVLDSRHTVQQVRVTDDIDLDFSKASLESFNQSLVLKADKWHWKGDHSLTMQQTALSTNWYNGGDNNMSISGEQKLTVSRYDENSKVTFEGVMDLKLSGYYTKADTIHSMRASDNEFTLSLKYGYRAWKKWYYSAQLYLKTPIFDYYNANSEVCKSTFLSPLETTLSLGVDYQYTSPNKKFTYSLLLAPLSYELKLVADGRVDETSYSLKEGHKTLHSFGSNITTKFEWQIADNISWSSRLYYFTTYSNLKVEFENTVNFKISRFFTSKIYLYPRFDDTRDTKTEYKEMLTVGFSYQW